MPVRIVEISALDPVFHAALVAEGLPVDDLADPGRDFVGLERDGLVVAHGGLEGQGADLLLRSVVVAPGARGQGLARRLVEALVDRASARGAARLWLLTTSSAAVFARLGWREATRAEVPPAIAATRQFAGLCPASSTPMVRDLVRRSAEV